MGPGLSSTTLFATLIANVFYGIAITLYAKSVSAMKRKRKSNGELNLPLVLISSAIFLFAIINVIGLWKNIYEAFVVYPDGAAAYLILIQTPAKTVIQTGQFGAILLTDALVVYRTFIVWNSNVYVIVLPCATLLATFVSGVIFFRLEHVSNATTSIFNKSMADWIISFLMCSLATTLYSTGIITYKLWKSQRRLRQHNISMGGGISRRVIRTIVDSAAIYSLNHLIYVVLYKSKSNVQSVPSYLGASIASITCSLMIVRSEAALKHPQIMPTYLYNNSMTTQLGPSVNEDISKGVPDGSTPSLRVLETTYISRGRCLEKDSSET